MSLRVIRPGSFVRNAAALSAAQLAAPVLNGALVIFMARRAGPEALGSYSLLVTAFMVVDQLRLFGLQRLVTRELASGRTEGLGLYRAFLGVADAGGLIGFAIFAIYGSWAGIAPLAVVAIGAGLLPSARVWANDAVFLALGRADFTARVAFAECTARVAVSVAILWWRGADLAALGATYSGGRLLAAALGARARRALIGPAAANPDWSGAGSLLGHLPAFFAVTALPLLLLRADMLVVGATAGVRDVGLYGGAARLVAIALLVPDGIMLANFARLSRAVDVARLRRAVATLCAAAVLVLVPSAAALAVWARALAQFVYGAEFGDSDLYLVWLAWSVPSFILCRAFGDALIAAGHQRRLALVILATTVGSVPVYWLTTLAFGTVGVAMAYLGSLLILLVLSAAASRPIFAPARSADMSAPRAPLPMEVR